MQDHIQVKVRYLHCRHLQPACQMWLQAPLDGHTPIPQLHSCHLQLLEKDALVPVCRINQTYDQVCRSSIVNNKSHVAAHDGDMSN